MAEIFTHSSKQLKLKQMKHYFQSMPGKNLYLTLEHDKNIGKLMLKLI